MTATWNIKSSRSGGSRKTGDAFSRPYALPANRGVIRRPRQMASQPEQYPLPYFPAPDPWRRSAAPPPAPRCKYLAISIRRIGCLRQASHDGRRCPSFGHLPCAAVVTGRRRKSQALRPVAAFHMAANRVGPTYRGGRPSATETPRRQPGTVPEPGRRGSRRRRRGLRPPYGAFGRGSWGTFIISGKRAVRPLHQCHALTRDGFQIGIRQTANGRCVQIGDVLLRRVGARQLGQPVVYS